MYQAERILLLKYIYLCLQALEALGEEKRCDLHIDLEMWTEETVRHSMTVAHLCYDNHRDLIIKTCQRVILSVSYITYQKTKYQSKI